MDARRTAAAEHQRHGSGARAASQPDGPLHGARRRAAAGTSADEGEDAAVRPAGAAGRADGYGHGQARPNPQLRSYQAGGALAESVQGGNTMKQPIIDPEKVGAWTASMRSVFP